MFVVKAQSYKFCLCRGSWWGNVSKCAEPHTEVSVCEAISNRVAIGDPSLALSEGNRVSVCVCVCVCVCVQRRKREGVDEFNHTEANWPVGRVGEWVSGKKTKKIHGMNNHTVLPYSSSAGCFHTHKKTRESQRKQGDRQTGRRRWREIEREWWDGKKQSSGVEEKIRWGPH